MNAKSIWEKMSVPKNRNEQQAGPSQASTELMDLAGLELKKRRLLRELAEIEAQRRQLSREIELKGIPIPWMSNSPGNHP